MGLSPLQDSFLKCLGYIIIGQVVRLLTMRTPEKQRAVSFITKLVIQVTLPCLLVRTMSQLREFPFDGVLLMLMYVAYNVIAAVVGIIAYHRRPIEVGAGLTCSLLGMNVGVFFYPIMEQIAGQPGVARLAMYDTANEIFVFLVYPFFFDWAQARYKRKLARQKADAEAAQPDSKKEKEKGDKAVEMDKLGKTPTPSPATPSPKSTTTPAASTTTTTTTTTKASTDETLHIPVPVVAPHELQSPAPTPSPAPQQKLTKSKKSKKGNKKKGKNSSDDESNSASTSDSPAQWQPPGRLTSVSPGLTATWDVEARAPTAPLPSERKVKRRLARARGAWARMRVYLHDTRNGRRILFVLRWVWKVVSILPLDAIIVGLAVGVGGQCSLPSFLDRLFLDAANANTLLGMVLLGMMLDLSPKRLMANAKDTSIAVVLRYIAAAAVTCAFYFGVGPHASSDLTRLVFAVGLFMPAPIVCGAYALEHGFNPNVEALIINVTMIGSFFIIWIIMCFVPLPGSSSSMFSSSLWSASAAAANSAPTALFAQ